MCSACQREQTMLQWAAVWAEKSRPASGGWQMAAGRSSGEAELGLPRFRGQVDKGHAMTLRLSINDHLDADTLTQQ